MITAHEIPARLYARLPLSEVVRRYEATDQARLTSMLNGDTHPPADVVWRQAMLAQHISERVHAAGLA